MTQQSGGAGYPGMTSGGVGDIAISDQLIVGGTDVLPLGTFFAGHLQAGVTGTFALQGNGFVNATDTQADGWDVIQGTDLAADSGANAVWVHRADVDNGHSYTDVTFRITDGSPSSPGFLAFSDGSTDVFVVSKAGSVGMFGHAAPAAPRTLAQSVIDAITDANAKTAVQAIANALADSGALTLT